VAKPGPKRRNTTNSRKKQPSGGLWWGFALANDAPAPLRRHFDDLVRAIKIAGTYERVHPQIVVAAAQTLVYMADADAEVAKRGLLISGPRGSTLVNPAVDARNAMMIRLRACLNDMGLTAASAKLGDAKAAAESEESGGSWGGLLGVVK
jgi:hypothetical protein